MPDLHKKCELFRSLTQDSDDLADKYASYFLSSAQPLALVRPGPREDVPPVAKRTASLLLDALLSRTCQPA